ncbi:protein DMP2-like [Magnolia sinica]|uniref:protein DMP2-like n=1 Tax=Magnolia sinica TaxID=86752 RepID=UPI002657E67D|nr:protein DMP2-like [Magnolia sinica]
MTSHLSSIAVDRTLASAANLIKLLPSSTIFAFQAISPSFSNHGTCYTSNKYLTSLLIALCAISCCFFCFTDSFIGLDGKLYYGLATFKGFCVFNETNSERWDKNMPLKDLKRFQIRWIDYVHAFFSVVVFMTFAFSDSGVQLCFFKNAGPDEKTLLVNLPLGAAFLSSVIFLIFPTSRKGIGYSNMNSMTN